MNINIDKLQIIFNLASTLSQQTDFSEILRVISTKSAAIFNAEVASIVMINPRTQETLKNVINNEDKNNKQQNQITQTVIIGWVMKNNESFFSNDLKKDTRFRNYLFEDITIKSAMCAPLKYQGRNIGYITIINNEKKTEYNEDSVQLLEILAAISAPHISNVQKIQEYFNIPLSDDSIIYKYRQFGLLGKSKSFIELLQSIEAATRCDVRVVLEGQTGTGKELIAKALHKLSSRSEYPFVAIDCGAIPQNLMESELFGHVKGSFTGANRDRTGLILEANKGTLFMDEINNLSMEMQSKLLRAIQESEIRPVGSNRKIKVDVRIISAASLSLLKLVEKEDFREDLYFRLMVYPISVPTLDERRRDIPLLAEHFLNKFAIEQKKKIEFFHRDILEYLMAKHWAGNIRELENFIERLITLTPQTIKILNVSDLPIKFTTEINEFISRHKLINNVSLKASLQQYEKELIINALEENDWNQNKVAHSLNILEQTLRAKMKKLDIVRPR